jgi:putative membrane protein insertion efficiency factor
MKSALMLLLRIYKAGISPLLGQHCRFYPSCSDYAQEAIAAHGAARGSLLTVKRLCKCHPWHAGGIDLVPTNTSSAAKLDHEMRQDHS